MQVLAKKLNFLLINNFFKYVLRQTVHSVRQLIRVRDAPMDIILMPQRVASVRQLLLEKFVHSLLIQLFS